MCGFAAVVSERVERARVERGLDRIAHRGPDGRGVAVAPDGLATLGHVRLAVRALDDGAQPIANETGEIVVAVNGELYDRDARASLEARGHRFATRSDSELVVHLYEERGVECVRALRGEFAFVLYDSKRARLVAARDRFGVKPLVYAERGGELLVASEIKALLAMGVPAEWDHVSFLHAIAHQYLPPARTLFRGISSLPPGHLLVAERGVVRIERYWDLPPPSSSDAAILPELEDAVRVRLDADVPIAFHLSGGLDSSSVLALARRPGARAFCVGFEHAPYAEAELARDAAEVLGASLDVVEVTQDAMVDALPDAVFHAEGLAINGQLPAKLVLSRAIAKAGFKVVLSGEGSDEALFGYAHLDRDRIATLAPEERAAALERLDRAHAAQVGVMLPREAIELPAIERALGFVPAFLSAKAGFGRELTALLAPHARASFDRRDPFGDLVASLEPERIRARHPVEQSAYLWTKLALAGYILRAIGDAMEMAASIEGRTPFLDHVFFERACALPIERKLRHGTTKVALREEMRGLLPEAIRLRAKQPFLAPPMTRFAPRRLRELALDLAPVPFFDRAAARAFVERALAEGTSEPAFMTVLTASLLQERFAMGAGS
jgi:asparagine synthase (glutamine-hydrolysing)